MRLTLRNSGGVPVLDSAAFDSDPVKAAAERYGIDPDVFAKVAKIESGGNSNAKSSLSSAKGLFQFTKGTAKQYGLADRTDASASADAAARLWKDNEASLKKALGRDPTEGEVYLAHQQGAAGAIKLLQNPDVPAAELLGKEAVRNNGGKDNMTAGDFASKWTARIDGGGADDPIGQTINRDGIPPLPVSEPKPDDTTEDPIGNFIGRGFTALSPMGSAQAAEGPLGASDQFGKVVAPIKQSNPMDVQTTPTPQTTPDVSAPMPGTTNIQTPHPMVIHASQVNSPEALGQMLSHADKRTVVINGAHDLGFMSDHVVIVPGRGGSEIDAEKALNSHEVPVLTQGMAAKIAKHLGTGSFAPSDKSNIRVAGDVVNLPNPLAAGLSIDQMRKLRELQAKHGLSTDQLKYLIAQARQG